MQTEFMKLAERCRTNDLRFEYIPDSTGVVISDGTDIIASAYIGDCSPLELELLNYKIDRFLDGESSTNDYVINRTEFERKQREAGHKNSDFMGGF